MTASEGQKQSHNLLEIAGGMNARLLELPIAEHATILNTLKNFADLRASNEQHAMKEAEASTRISKALSIV